MRIAVATVLGDSMIRLWKMGADPDAWKPIIRGSFVALPLSEKLTIAFPISGDVAGVSNRKNMEIRGVSKFFNNLKSGCFLTFDPVRIDRIDDGNALESAEFTDEPQGIVKATTQGDDLCSVKVRLHELAACDLARREQDRAKDAGAGGISRGSRRGIAVEAQIAVRAPRSSAFETATVIPRSLKDRLDSGPRI